MKHYMSVHAIIIFKNKFFIQKRDINRNIHFPNFWGLFGGKVLRNESRIKAIKRELKEETNIKIDKVKKLFNFIINGKDLKITRNITYYVVNLKKIPNKVKIYEGSNYKFSNFQDLKKLKFNTFYYSVLCFYYYNEIKKENLIPTRFIFK